MDSVAGAGGMLLIDRNEHGPEPKADDRDIDFLLGHG
jgi:hypothetical protein